MIRKVPFLLRLLAATAAGLLAASIAASAHPKLHTIHVRDLQELQAYFAYNPARDIVISGHRGGMLPGYPENCLESCEKTLALLPSFFEIDPRLTKDGVVVLMHDATLDRTTTGKGRVANYTYKELQQFHLKDRQGKVTPYKIPTVDEILAWGRDKTVFNFDNKEVPWAVYSARLKKEWNYPNIILSVRSLEEAKFYFDRGNDNVMFCVEISSLEHFQAYDRSGIPWQRIMAYIRLAVNPELQEVYDLLHARGVSTMTSITGSSDKIANPKDRRVAYVRELVAEPDIIETDYPAEFAGLPLSRAAIHRLQDSALRDNRRPEK